jgi:hypothetical protein
VYRKKREELTFPTKRKGEKKKTSLASSPNKSLTTTKGYGLYFFFPSLFGCTQNTKIPIKKVPSSPPTMGCLLFWAFGFHFLFDPSIGH